MKTQQSKGKTNISDLEIIKPAPEIFFSQTKKMRY
jgi:hypothetical protein